MSPTFVSTTFPSGETINVPTRAFRHQYLFHRHRGERRARVVPPHAQQQWRHELAGTGRRRGGHADPLWRGHGQRRRREPLCDRGQRWHHGDRREPAHQPAVASAAQTYTYNGANVTAADLRIRRAFTTTIKLRNRGKT